MQATIKLETLLGIQLQRERRSKNKCRLQQKGQHTAARAAGVFSKALRRPDLMAAY